MYVNPFWLGVGVTILAELVLLVAAAVYYAGTDDDEE